MHLIHKHIFEIEAERKEFAYEVHNMLGDVMNTSFYPKLDKLLEKYDLVEETLSFDCIELNLPNIREKYWKEQLVNEMLNKMESFLQEKIPLAKKNRHTNTIVSKKVPNKHLCGDLLFAYLRTGNLPTNPISTSLFTIEEGILIESGWMLALQKVLMEHENHWKRFFFNLSISFLQRILSYIHSSGHPFLQQIQDLADLLSEKVNRKERVNEVVPLFLFLFFEERTDIPVLARKFLSMLEEDFQLNQHLPINRERETRIWEKYKEHTGDVSSTFPLLVQIVELLKTAGLNNSRKEISENEPGGLPEKEMEPVAEMNKFNSNIAETENVYFIENAGLVLLHPFLKSLFSKLNYLNEDGLIDRDKTDHATCIIQYAARGEDNYLETDLLLNKIMCGLGTDSLIKTNVFFKQEEREIADDLLLALIGHWKMLRNTSVEGLRNTFLQRKGKVTAYPDRYELQVENSAVDILMDQLPWGISFIQLPWMLKPLHVNWQTN